MNRAYHLKRKYGITEDDYDWLLRTQGKRCAVCGRAASNWKLKLSVDHDHKSGEIRGLLCGYCNQRIVGRHRREVGAELLLKAYTYLARKKYTGWFVPKRKKKHGKNIR